MRVIAQILSAALLAGMTAAQSAPASQTVQPKPQPQPSKVQNGINAVKGALKNPFAPKNNAAQPVSQAKPQAATKPTTAVPATKPTTPTQAKAVPQPKATPPVKKSAPVTAKVASKPKKIAPAKKVEAPVVVAKATPPKLPNPGKRDPFLSPIAAAAARGPAANCSTGKRCLVVEQIALKGVVQTKTGNIAMVENGAKRSYYLHENDALFDGSVVKITGDSVTFRQESSDILGRPVSKEVVKKVSAPAV